MFIEFERFSWKKKCKTENPSAVIRIWRNLALYDFINYVPQQSVNISDE